MKENYKEVSKLSSDVMNTAQVLLDYCKSQANSEDITRIRPIVDLLFNTADTLCFKIMEMEEEF